MDLFSIALLVLTLSIPPSKQVVASWYGPGFHGKKMANGQRFDMYKMTAAHKHLPFGTVLKVTNPKNKKSVRVKITDRGPYIKGRDLDLSKEAVLRLGAYGTIPVNVEVVECPKNFEACKEIPLKETK